MKNLIRIVSFVVVFAFLFNTLNFATSKANQGWTDFYKIPKNSIDIVFMGNSHNFESFQPRIVEDILHVNSYSLGTNGENIVVSYYELKELLKYQKPKVIVLETFALEISNLIYPSYLYEFIDSYPISLNRIILWGDFFKISDLYNQKRAFPRSLLRKIVILKDE